jgi:hypothetical protein
LILWAAVFVDRIAFGSSEETFGSSRLARGLLAVTLVLGVVGTAYEVVMLRSATFLYDNGRVAGLSWMDSDHQLGKRSYALRRMYETLSGTLAPAAVVQNNPATEDFIPRAYYSGRDSAADSFSCKLLQNEERANCKERVRRVAMLYAFKSDELQPVCSDYGIDVVVAQDTDPAWSDPESWVWKRRPLFANDFARAFECRSVSGFR